MKRRFTKSLVAMIALVAMLVQNSYGVYALAAATDAPVVENLTEDAGSTDIVVESTTEEVSYDDQIMPISDDIIVEDNTDTNISDGGTEIIVDDGSTSDDTPGSLEVLNTQITGSGMESVEFYLDTTELNADDKFRVIIRTDAAASYSSVLNEELDSTVGGYYTISNLEKQGFNIRVEAYSDVNVTYTSNGSTPVIKLTSNAPVVNKLLEVRSLSAGNGSPVSSIYGEGYDTVTIDFIADNFKDKTTKYALYVETSAAATVNGQSVSGGIKGLTQDTKSLTIENLDGASFSAYVLTDSAAVLYSDARILSTDNALASITIREEAEIRVKRTYSYSDADVTVTATLEYADAVPDDAEFKVTPIKNAKAVDAYIDALNRADSETEYTEDNTLLYDIAFLVDKVDENGNVIPGEKVEYEPEAGSVTIDIKFNKSQLSNELGATDGSEVKINHLPLTESVKESVDTTVEATNISASDVIVEPVNANVDVVENGADTATLSLSDLSVVAVTSGSKNYTPGTARTFADFLGAAKNIGVVANKVSLAGHLETNIATKELTGGNGPWAGPRNDGYAGKSYIGSFTGTNGLMIDPGNSSNGKGDQYVYTTVAAAEKFGSNTVIMENGRIKEYKRSGFQLDFSMSQSEINSYVDSIISYVKGTSQAAFAEKNAFDFTNVKDTNTIDIRSKGAGTYYINFDAGEYTGQELNICLNDNQTVVLNIPDTKVKFGQYKYAIGTGNSTSTQGATSDDTICQKVIFNCPNATYAQTVGATSATFLVPNAQFDNNSVAAGWLVANNITKIGGQEWHCVFHDMPDPKTDSFTLKAKKTTSGYAGSDATFTFDLYNSDSRWNCGQWIESKSVTINGSNPTAAVNFSEITANAQYGAGKHYYVIKENVSNKLANWTYDPAEYHVTVNVTNSSNGDYTVTGISYVQAGAVNGISASASNNEAVFNNTYSEKDGKFRFGVSKKLSASEKTKISDADKNQDFIFELYETNSLMKAEGNNASGRVIDTVKIKGSDVSPYPTALFKELTYKNVTFGNDGVARYYYVIKEILNDSQTNSWSPVGGFYRHVIVEIRKDTDGEYLISAKYLAPEVNVTEDVRPQYNNGDFPANCDVIAISNNGTVLYENSKTEREADIEIKVRKNLVADEGISTAALENEQFNFKITPLPSAGINYIPYHHFSNNASTGAFGTEAGGAKTITVTGANVGSFGTVNLQCNMNPDELKPVDGTALNKQTNVSYKDGAKYDLVERTYGYKIEELRPATATQLVTKNFGNSGNHKYYYDPTSGIYYDAAVYFVKLFYNSYSGNGKSWVETSMRYQGYYGTPSNEWEWLNGIQWEKIFNVGNESCVPVDGPIEFRNGYETINGSLKVNKVVTGTVDNAVEFTFTLKDSAGKPVSAKYDTADGRYDAAVADNSNRTGTYKFRAGESVEFKNLKNGNYTVTETNMPAGYIQVSGDGTVNVPKGGAQEVTITNTKPYVEIPLTGKKVVFMGSTGNEYKKALPTFSFTVTPKSSYDGLVSYTKKFVSDENGIISPANNEKPFAFNKAGKYEFTIKEDSFNIPGFSMDSANAGTGVKVAITVTENPQTKVLSIDAANGVVFTSPYGKTNNQFIGKFAFRNYYEKAGSDKVVLKKSVAGGNRVFTQADIDTFKFNVYLSDVNGTKGGLYGEYKLPASAVGTTNAQIEITLNKDTNGTKFTQDDIDADFYYLIEEAQSGNVVNEASGSLEYNPTGVAYLVKATVGDTNTADLNVTHVVASKGKDDAAFSAFKSDTEIPVSFTNVFTTPGQYTFIVDKTLNGTDNVGQTFYFTLKEKVNGSYVDVKKLTYTIGQNSNATSTHTISYTRADVGSHEYRIVETDASGVAYADYSTGDVKDAGGNVIGTVTLDASGNKVVLINNILMDTTVSDTTVTVAYSNGVLTVADEAGNGSKTVNYVNEYQEPEPTSFDIEGYKRLRNLASTLSNDATKNDTFTFTVYETDSSFDYSGKTVAKCREAYSGQGGMAAPGENLVSCTVDDNTGNEAFGFKGIPLAAAGDYYYTVVETLPADDNTAVAGVQHNGITYDERVYDIHVNVYDAGNGKLAKSVTTTIHGTGNEVTANPAKVDFENSFYVENVYNIEAKKLLNSNVGGFGLGNYTFELYEVVNGKAGDTPIDSKITGNDGLVTFKNISYSLNDFADGVTTVTKNYVVKEQTGNAPGWTYNVYGDVPVTVTLTKNTANDGTVTLSHSIAYTNSTASDATVVTEDTDFNNKAIIVNDYYAEGVVSIIGTKSLIGVDANGDALKLDDFAGFKVGLYTDASCTDLVATAVTDDKTGAFSFELPGCLQTSDQKAKYVLSDVYADGKSGAKKQYTYYIKEINDGTYSTLKYDTNVTKVTYTLSANGAAIEAENLMYNDQASAIGAGIINRSTSGAKVAFNVTKSFTGKATRPVFTYILEHRKTDGSWETVETKNTDEASFQFEHVASYTIVNKGTTDYYRVSEQIPENFKYNAALGGYVEYDGTEPKWVKEGDAYVLDKNGNKIYAGLKYATDNKVSYIAAVSVTENADGLGVTAKTAYYEGDAVVANMTAAANQDNGAAFSNAYTGYGKVALQGTKYLNGEHTNVPAFEFKLYETDSSFTNGTLVQTVTNAADGSFAFKDIVYTEADLTGADENGNVYKYYRIAESEKSPYTTDQDVRVVVTLKAAEDGSISAVANATKMNTKFADTNKWYVKLYLAVLGALENAGSEGAKKLNPTAIRFDNYYDAEGQIEFSVNKFFAGSGASLSAAEINILAGKTYTFQLKEGNTVLRTATIAGSRLVSEGNVLTTVTEAFAPIKYSTDTSAKAKAGNNDDVNTVYKTGAHTYTVSEVNNNSGIAENKELYTANVNVSENRSSNALDISVSIDKTVGGVAETSTPTATSENGSLTAPVVSFTNRIIDDHISVPVLGKKTLTEVLNAYNADLEYTFNLKEKDGNAFRVTDSTVTEGYKSVTALSAVSKGSISADAGKFAFGNELYFDLSDLAGSPYTFEISEAKPSVSGVQFAAPADGKYTFTVTLALDQAGKLVATVADADGTLYTRSKNSAGTAVSSAEYRFEFTNDYVADGTFSLTGTKKMLPVNAALGTYDFYLIDAVKGANGNVVPNTVKRDGYEAVTLDAATVYAKTTQNNTAGTIAFSNIETLNNSDIGKTYYYIIREAKGADTNINYSTDVYYVAVPVSLNADSGKIVGTPQIYKNDATVSSTAAEVSTFEFINENTLKAPGVIAGSKKLIYNGNANMLKPFVKGDFTVELYDSTGTNLLATTDISATDANRYGYFTFTGNKDEADADSNLKYVPELSYGVGDAGDHTYYVKETVPAVDAGGEITYDTAVFEVHINVAYSGGTLTVGNATFSKGSQTGNGIWTAIQNAINPQTLTFVNDFTPAGCYWDPSGIKELAGRQLRDGEFTFQLKEVSFVQKDLAGGTIKTYTANDSEIKNNVATTTNTGAAIAFDHTKIEFLQYKNIDALGTHTYEITELNNSNIANGISYSTAKYTYTVEVGMKADGTGLEITSENTSYDDGGSNTSSVLEAAVKSKYSDADFLFGNTYSAVAALDLYGTKLMNGRALAEGETYQFTIAEADENRQIKAGGKSATVTNDGSVISFKHDAIKMLKYDQDDAGKSFYYIISEVPVSAGGVTSDNTTFCLKVDVKHPTNGNATVYNGTLVLEASIGIVDAQGTGTLSPITLEDATGERLLGYHVYKTGQAAVSFTNNFIADGEITLSGYKHVKHVVDGEDVKDAAELAGKYTFCAYEYETEAERDSGISPGRKPFGNATTCDASGLYTISKQFTQADVGTHYIKVYEWNPTNQAFSFGTTPVTVKGVTYDLKEYNIDISVATNGTSKLSVTAASAASADSDTGVTFDSATNTLRGLDYTNVVTEIRILKESAETGLPLSGAVLEIYAADADGNATGAYLDHWTSTATYHTVDAPLTAGKTYVLHEAAVPAGYVQAADKTFTVPADGSGITVTMIDTVEKGAVRLTKVDAITAAKLSDAKFELRRVADNSLVTADRTADAGVYTYNKNGGDSEFTVNAQGELVINGLPYGDYYFVETQAPVGYSVNTTHVSVTINSTALIDVQCEDTPEDGKVFIRKVDKNGITLAGAQLEIYAASKQSDAAARTGEALDSWVSRTTAHEITNVKLTRGTYYVLHEVSAPAGYLTARDQVFMVPTDGSDITVVMTDEDALGRVRLTKLDRTTKAALSDASFELRRASDNTAVTAATTTTPGAYLYDETVSNTTLTVSPSGILTVDNLPYGAYYFVETKAPVGYSINTTPIRFTINSEVYVDVQCEDTPEDGKVFIRKVDENGTTLPGAELEIYAASVQSPAAVRTGTALDNWISRTTAHEVTNVKLVRGNYYVLHEVSAPAGYALAADVVFQVPMTGDITVVMEDKIGVGRVDLTKLDRDTGATLAGAEFSLYRVTTAGSERVYADGTRGAYVYSDTAANGTFVVNAAGRLEITMLPFGDYYFTETKAPTGYTLNTAPISFTVSDTDVSASVVCRNVREENSIRIRKIDAATGAALAGATLQIRTTGGTVLEEWVSTTAEHIVTAELTPGTEYVLHEVAAPTGYRVAADVRFTAPAAGGEITVTMEDESISGRVRLTKRDAATRDTLAGAVFALYTDTGARVYAAGTAGSYRYSPTSGNALFAVNSAGVLEISDLPYGSYYFTEITAPSGYALSTERLAFSVVTDESLVEVTMLNSRVLGAARLRKVSLDGGAPLAGAVFELYARTPSSLTSAIASTIYSGAYYRVGTYTTDATGSIYVGDLPWDDYYFVEVTAPAGYTITTDVNGDPLVYTFTVGEGTTADMVYDLGSITNGTSGGGGGGGVLGARVDDGRRNGGVLSGVLGVRAAPKSGVLGERIGPVTGDATNIILWLLLLVASISAIVGVALANVRRRRSAR